MAGNGGKGKHTAVARGQGCKTAEKENGLNKSRARNPRLGKTADPCADQAGYQAGHTAVAAGAPSETWFNTCNAF